jgi:hypothetical protein
MNRFDLFRFILFVVFILLLSIHLVFILIYFIVFYVYFIVLVYLFTLFYFLFVCCSTLTHVLKEIENKAPLIQQQNEEYERLKIQNQNLAEKMEQALNQMDSLKNQLGKQIKSNKIK